MKSKPAHTFLVLLVILLSAASIVGCSASTPAPMPTATNTATPTKTPIPSITVTSTPEPSLTPMLLPAISLPVEVISSENIDRLQLLDTRDLAGIPEEFLHRKLDFTSDGRIIVGDYDTIVYVWDGLTGQPIATLNHFRYIWNVAISPDGTIAASGGELGAIRLWDLKAKKEIYRLFHSGTIWSLAFSSDNSMLASGSLGSDSVTIWNLIDGDKIDYIADVHVESLAFSPDGHILAIGTADNKIILWNIVTKKTIKTFVFDLRRETGPSGIQGALFSPDGKTIAAANADNIAMVWDIRSGEKLSTIIGKGTFIAMSEGTLTFSPDSKIIAVGNDNGEIIFWDLSADKELRTIGSQMCIPGDLNFGSDGKAFEVACWNGIIQLWGLP